MRFLQQARADPNIQDSQSETPLHKAAATCVDMFVWTRLMRGGGRSDVRNRCGLTPLNIATKSNNHTAAAVMTQFELRWYDNIACRVYIQADATGKRRTPLTPV